SRARHARRQRPLRVRGAVDRRVHAPRRGLRPARWRRERQLQYWRDRRRAPARSAGAMKLPACLAALSLLSLTAFGVDIVAHRGASHDAPENTLPSFKLGWEQGADADELDIYLTKDGRIVVLHDKSTK